jgi:cytidylate kinase
MIITLDGPAGSGKSSTSRALAKRLGAVYLDTGAMYRSVALAALERGIDPADSAGLTKLSEKITIDFHEGDDGQRLILDGVDRSLDIRRSDVEKTVSQVSSHSGVRENMVSMQRKIASNHEKLVVEGRDAGSVVFPDAEFKFFLTASPELRALRRQAQNKERGIASGNVLEDIQKRDETDSGRKVSPLVIPTGAIQLDNSNLTLDETIQKIIDFLIQCG